LIKNARTTYDMGKRQLKRIKGIPNPNLNNVPGRRLNDSTVAHLNSKVRGIQ